MHLSDVVDAEALAVELLSFRLMLKRLYIVNVNHCLSFCQPYIRVFSYLAANLLLFCEMAKGKDKKRQTTAKLMRQSVRADNKDDS